MQIFCGLLLLAGAGFVLVAALGLYRLGDVFLRMHASTKAGTLGIGLIVIAFAIWTDVGAVRVKAVMILLFMVVTAPIAAHLIGRAVYRTMSARERELGRPDAQSLE